jgi:hypothetical protein
LKGILDHGKILNNNYAMKSLEVGGFADEEKVYPFVEIVSEWSRVGSQFGIKDNVVENTVDISSMKMFVT